MSLDQNKRYKVITIDFLANGGDYYTTLKTITCEHRVDVGLDYAEAFLKYAQALPKYAQALPKYADGKIINRLDTSNYSTQLFIDKLK